MTRNEQMADSYYATNKAKWHRFSPMVMATLSQDFMCMHLDARGARLQPEMKKHVLEWWNQAIKNGLITC